MKQKWWHTPVRTAGHTLILIGTAILAGAVTAVIISDQLGPDARQFANVIGGAVCLSIVLGAILFVLIKGMRQEILEDFEEGI